jgi:hypothetical protein
VYVLELKTLAFAIGELDHSGVPLFRDVYRHQYASGRTI